MMDDGCVLTLRVDWTFRLGDDEIGITHSFRFSKNLDGKYR